MREKQEGIPSDRSTHDWAQDCLPLFGNVGPVGGQAVTATGNHKLATHEDRVASLVSLEAGGIEGGLTLMVATGWRAEW